MRAGASGWSASRRTTVLNSPIAFPAARATWKPSLRQRPDNWEFATSSSAPIRPGTTERWNAVIVRTKSAFTTHTVSIPSPTLVGRKLPTNALATPAPCVLSAGLLPESSFLPSLSNMFDKPTFRFFNIKIAGCPT